MKSQKFILPLAATLGILCFSITTTYAAEDMIVSSVNDTNEVAQANVQNGWVQEDGEYYYYENGVAVKSEWRQIGEYRYYFNYDGTMAHDGRYNFDEYTYGFDSNGHMIVGWYDFSGSDYYDEWYYYDAYGHEVSGVQTINGETFLFEEWGGRLLTDYCGQQGNTLYATNGRGVIIDSKVMTEGLNEVNNEYFFVRDSDLVTRDWVEIDGNKYYFEYDGKRVHDEECYYIWQPEETEGHYGFNSNGTLKKGWSHYIDEYYDEWFYYGEDGRAYAGAHNIGNERFYLVGHVIFIQTLMEI